MIAAKEAFAHTSAMPSIPTQLIIERDDGRYQIGLHDDAPGPFESREFAEAVAAQGEGRDALAAS
jgi:hypothetical protein